MFYGNSVQDTRPVFFSCWNKFLAHQNLSPLEQQIVDVMLLHPEYHAFFEQKNVPDARVYHASLGETNPFFHLGLHLALRDQLATQRPLGIVAIYQQLLQAGLDEHAVEHRMMEVLAECLWRMQQSAQGFVEADYLQALQHLIDS